MSSGHIDLGNPVANHPLNQSLVSWWLPLPNNSGGTRLFDIGGGKHGTLTNGSSWSTAPNSFGAITLDGTNDYVSGSALYSGSMTVAVHAMGVLPTTTQDAIGDSSARIALRWYDGFNGSAPAWIVQTSTFHIQNATAAAANEIRTLIGVWDESSKRQEFFVNGKSVALNTRSGSIGTLGNLRLGIHANGTANPFRGSIYSASQHSRALSVSECWLLHEQMVSGFPNLLRRYSRKAYFLGSGSSGVSGTLTATLGALTLSSAGTVDVQGTLSKTLGAATLSSTGTVDVVGSTSQTLGNLTSSSTATVAVVGESNPTLGSLTASASATVDVSGSLDSTLGSLTSNSTGTVDISGTLSATLADATLSATGSVSVVGILATTLESATLVSDGTVSGGSGTGALVVTLADGTLTSAGTVLVSAASAVTLADASLTSTGTVLVLATSSITLSDTVLVATGVLDASVGNPVSVFGRQDRIVSVSGRSDRIVSIFGRNDRVIAVRGST